MKNIFCEREKNVQTLEPAVFQTNNRGRLNSSDEEMQYTVLNAHKSVPEMFRTLVSQGLHSALTPSP